jgi:hypothetical protein
MVPPFHIFATASRVDLSTSSDVAPASTVNMDESLFVKIVKTYEIIVDFDGCENGIWAGDMSQVFSPNPKGKRVGND